MSGRGLWRGGSGPARRGPGWRGPGRLGAWVLALLTASTTAAAPAGLGAQQEPIVKRPVPGPVVPPVFVQQAMAAGTRSADGSPGPAYWQQSASYRIDARLDPANGRLTGRETITYRNASPQALPLLVLHLYQNLHAPGAVRNEEAEVTGGIEIESVSLNGQRLPPVEEARRPPAWQVQSTMMALYLPEPVPSGGTLEVEIAWAFTVPQNGAGRMGHSDREMYFLAYWFPKLAVFDDLRGWDAEPYMGISEFYDGFGDFEVSLTVPAGWTVMATGQLENPGEVFSEQTLARLEAAAAADTVVHVATRPDREGGRVTLAPPSGELVYRFRAGNVRDFTWTASNEQLWDATSALVPERPGEGADDRVAIHSFWREDRAPLWAGQALYGKHSIEHHSRYTGLAYPWPHMTSVEGDQIIGGGMEFPMLTLIGSYQGRTPEDLYFVTAHELAHMWIPMIVGTNEKRHAWMDEGATTFLEGEARTERFPGSEPHATEREGYLQLARVGLEQELMRHGDFYEPGPAYGIASYPKPASLLYTLRAMMGEEAFGRAYRTFVSEWAYKHPTPWDLFNTFERIAGQDLDWFWQSFYYETWTLDHAVIGVGRREEGPYVVVEDQGFAVMPATVLVETTAGGTVERVIPVTEWLAGKTRVELQLPASVGEITSVRIGPGLSFLDTDPSDNIWLRR